MSALSKQPHLQHRGAVFQYRRRLPTDIAEIVGKSEIKFSLKTGDRAEAIRRCRIEDVRHDDWFKTLRRGEGVTDQAVPLPKIDLAGLVRAYVQKTDKRHSNTEPSPDVEGRLEQMLEVQQMIGLMEDPGATEAKEQIGILVGELLRKHQLDGRLSGDQSADLWQLARRAILELNRRDKARLESDFTREKFDELFSSKAEALAEKPSPSFAEHADDFLEEYRQTALAKQIDRKRVAKVASSVSLIKELIGPDLPLEQVDYDACRDFRNRIAEVPTNASKHYPGMPIKEAISFAKKDGARTLSFESQQLHLGILKQILAHAVRKGLVGTNPADGLSPLAAKPAAKDLRRAFSIEELNTLFAAPIFTGCVNDDRGYAKAGPRIIKRVRYWAPVIALFSGLRANEIAQLRIDDIQVSAKGTHFIRITDDGPDQRVKNAASRRVVPIHPKLRELGFVDFVERKRKAGSERLFPELKLDKQGYFSTGLTRWFNSSFQKSVFGEYESGRTFHSFRHNFRDALRLIDAPNWVLQGLGGWQQNSGASESYGSTVWPDELAKWLNRINYADLKLP